MEKKRRALMGAALLAPLLAAVICLIVVTLGSNQAGLPNPMPLTFSGEYSRDGLTWAPLTPQSDLSASGGDLYLRGHFDKPVPQGALLNYYCNHIGVEIRIDGALSSLDPLLEMQQLGLPLMRSMCGREWQRAAMPEITPGSLVDIRLHSPHAFGNRDAYREFLGTLCITGSQTDILQKKLEAHTLPWRLIGSVLMIAALMILGAALSAAIMRVQTGASWFVAGLLSLFAGAFMLFDPPDVSFFSELTVVNTYVWQISAMLALLFAGFFAAGSLTGRARRTADAALFVSAALDTVIIALSFLGSRGIYDFLPVWAASQMLLCPALAVCCALELRKITSGPWLTPLSGLALFAVVPLDIFGLGMSITSRGTCAKAVLLYTFLLHVLSAGRTLANQYATSMRVGRMEKELEESRVAIMLSQIQPHFLYNSLSVIQELCHSEPLEAERAIGRFAEFLRGSMTALTSDKVIPFADELNHIRSYLEIEQLRFGDQLRIVYEIETEGFSLPTLTLQPLVENAVRHGVRKNENGGTVLLSVREMADRYEIAVADDGPGFRPESLGGEDGAHVGIQNVKKRLDRMCGGTLTIDSAPGRGTRVTVNIPKEGKPC